MATDLSQPGEPFIAPVLGDEAHSLILCNQKLQELGIDETIKLPRIVVIGDQSTGKSSLIERISSIKVPKATNLCTRCPIAINLTSGRAPTFEWECSVYIEERYVYDTTIKHKRVSKAHPLGPWKLLQADATPMLVGTTNIREKLLDLIFQAQNLVLNPLRSSTKSLKESTKDAAEKFSPNVIRIDISVGDCPNLSFVDLPGVIQTVGKDEPEYYVDLVASLAREYAKDDNNVLMLTLPCNHDVSNSRSYSIVQRENAQSHTIAVFTKVDVARAEEQRDCLARYFGNESEEEFELGHHIVMLRGDLAPNENPDEVEATFFLQPPWIDLPEDTRAHLGIQNLIAVLRRTLFKKTADTLPENLDKIQARVAEVRGILGTMPAPPDTTELPYQLREQMFTCQNKLKQLFVAAHDQEDGSSRSKLMDCMRDFNDQIQANAPTMIVRTEDESKALEEVENLLSASQPTKSADASSDNNETATTLNQSAKSKSNTRSVARPIPRTFRLEEIRVMNKERYQSSISGDIELRAVEHMHCLSVESWDLSFTQFMRRISKIVNVEVLACIQKTFQDHQHLPIYERVISTTKEYIDDAVHVEWTYLQRLCDAERIHPLTFDNASLKDAEVKSLALRQQKRIAFRLDLEKKKHKASKQKGKEPSLADIGPDKWEVEVKMAAKTRAYYEVASHRFVDAVCQNILAHLVPRFHADLVDYLRSDLGLENVAKNRSKIVALMSEDSEREAQRQKLESELTRLNAGHKYIASVLGSYTPSDSQPDQSGDEDSTIFDGDNATNTTTPNKRKMSEAGSDGTFNDDPQTPSKRLRKHGQTCLPNRLR